MKLNQKSASWLLVLAALMWGSSFTASKICINSGMREFEIVFDRFFLGSIVTWAVFHKKLRRPTRTAVRTGVALGLLTSLTFTLEMFGLAMTQTTKAAFLTSTNIVMMPFLYYLFCRVRPGVHSLIAAGMTMAGVGVLSLSGAVGGFAAGDVLLLLDALTYALNSLIMVMIGGDDSPVQISFFQFVTTAAVMGVLTCVQGTGGSYPPAAVAAVLYQALIPTVVCFLIKNITIQYLNPVRCTLILSLESVFCALVSALMLHDVVTPRMLGGIVLIFSGVLVEVLRPSLRRRPRRTAAKSGEMAETSPLPDRGDGS